MERIFNTEKATNKVLSDIRELLIEVKQHAATDIKSLSDGVRRLQKIRSSVYENLNQIQHEYLILQALEWLQQNKYQSKDLKWFWNPRQTGDSEEPDLVARDKMSVVLSAEATTSENPQGAIDTRMSKTLKKLNTMVGAKFYFMRTVQMAQRARTKIDKNSWQIEVVQLSV